MRIMVLAGVCLCFFSVSPARTSGGMARDENPFLNEYTTPFQTPPFDRIRNEHYFPAFLEGMKQQKAEIETIVIDPDPPSFQNTIEALERSGLTLERVNLTFESVRGAEATDEIQAIAARVAPLLSQHRDDIMLNGKLFERVSAVYNRRAGLTMTPEQSKLLEYTYKDFVRGGATLSPEQKERFRKINEELSTLSLTFDENVLHETMSYRLVIERTEDLAGLPQGSIEEAANAAVKAGLKGKWLFTTKKPSMIPFLQYAQNRELRKKLFTAYIERCNRNNEYDTKAIISKIASLRVERAHVLGYATHADYVLERNMAKTPAAVRELLHTIWEPALKRAKLERDDMQALIRKEGGTFALEPWDWWYYAEKVRKEKYDLDENELRPYFVLENVIQGAFETATRLYGIHFTERNDIPKYSPEVRVFEVKRSDGSHVGILYTDYFPRPGKQAGAWCGGYRGQERRGDSLITALVTNVGNFSRPTAEAPALLTLEEVETLFHEFGHALHALLQNQTYRSLGVPVDFVELPSQIMENWALEPEVLKLYARHYTTGEIIPEALVEKIKKSDTFNQGFETVEYLAACYLDMDWHTLSDSGLVDATTFENNSLAKIGLIPEIVVRYRSPYFAHIWSSMYSAGYYSYIWAEQLDADAFDAFKEKGLFDQATAASFRANVLEKGATDDAMKQYIKFRGRKPSVEPLLKRRGLL